MGKTYSIYLNYLFSVKDLLKLWVMITQHSRGYRFIIKTFRQTSAHTLDSRGNNANSNLVSENKSSLPNENLNQDSADLDDEIPF